MQAPSLATGSTQPAGAGAAQTQCPDCGTPRVPGARYCEACRFDFAAPQAAGPTAPAPAPIPSEQPTKAHVPTPPPPSTPPSQPQASPAPTAATVDEASPYYGKSAWAVVTAEPSLATPEEASACPTDEPPRSYPLDFAENLVGRRNARAGVHPEVPVDDKAVSTRHLKLCRRGTGMVVIDIGSTNGTKVNGHPVATGVEIPLMPGDHVDIGAWTRIVLETR